MSFSWYHIKKMAQIEAQAYINEQKRQCSKTANAADCKSVTQEVNTGGSNPSAATIINICLKISNTQNVNS